MASAGAFALGSLSIVGRATSVRRAAGWVLGCALLVGGTYAVLGPGPSLLLAPAGSLTTRISRIRTCLRSRTALASLAVVATCVVVSQAPP